MRSDESIKPEGLGWVNSVMPSCHHGKVCFHLSCALNTMFIEMYQSHWLEKNLLLNEGFDSYINKFAIYVLKVNDTVGHLPCEFSRFIYMVERSLLNLPTTDHVASNFAKEWRFHINWNVVSQVKQKGIAWNNNKGPDLWSQTKPVLTPKEMVF